MFVLFLLQLVAPGDAVSSLPETGVVRVGPGLASSRGLLVASRAGRLSRAPDGSPWVLGSTGRYRPSVGDVVLGTVLQRFPESYSVDVGASGPADLPLLAFDVATKRAAPRLAPGDVVLARVDLAPVDSGAVLACKGKEGEVQRVQGAGKPGAGASSSSASTSVSGLGPLAGGHEVRVSTAAARLLSTSPPFVRVLGSHLRFEMAVGANGRVWIDATDPRVPTLVGRVCQHAVLVPKDDAEEVAWKALEDAGVVKRG